RRQGVRPVPHGQVQDRWRSSRRRHSDHGALSLRSPKTTRCPGRSQFSPGTSLSGRVPHPISNRYPPTAQSSLGQRMPGPSTSMGDMSKRIVIIGAGLAGTTAARELNERGQAVTVIDPQAGDTCERPPLSKHLFDNSRHHLPYHLESTEHITFIRDWAEEITLAEAAVESRYTAETQLHPQRLTDDHATVGTVHLASGESIDFPHCILATGMEANRPQIPEYPEALPVYDFGDAEWILARVEEATQPLNVGVLGSGYLGMEVATSAVAAGHRATVYLRGGAPLRKQLSAPVRQALFEAHKAAGVEFVTHTSSPDDIDANIHDLFITSVGARPRLIPIDGDRPAEAWEV